MQKRAEEPAWPFELPGQYWRLRAGSRACAPPARRPGPGASAGVGLDFGTRRLGKSRGGRATEGGRKGGEGNRGGPCSFAGGAQAAEQRLAGGRKRGGPGGDGPGGGETRAQSSPTVAGGPLDRVKRWVARGVRHPLHSSPPESDRLRSAPVSTSSAFAHLLSTLSPPSHSVLCLIPSDYMCCRVCPTCDARGTPARAPPRPCPHWPARGAAGPGTSALLFHNGLGSVEGAHGDECARLLDNVNHCGQRAPAGKPRSARGRLRRAWGCNRFYFSAKVDHTQRIRVATQMACQLAHL